MSEARVWMDKLNGMTAEGIRNLMAAEGIKGTPRDPQLCAIAQLLRAKDKSITHVRVGGGGVTVLYNGVRELFLVDRDVCEFVARFDYGHYPELIARPEDAVPAAVSASMDPGEITITPAMAAIMFKTALHNVPTTLPKVYASVS